MRASTLVISIKDPKISEILQKVEKYKMDYSMSNSKLKIKVTSSQNDVASQIMKIADDWSLS